MAHQPQARNAFLGAGAVSTLDLMEAKFLHSAVVYEEDDMPVCDRWFRILEYLPHIRGRHLYEDLSDTYQELYQRGAGSTVAACLDFVLLRCRFFMVLKANGIGRAHQNDYEIEASQVWIGKLMDRIADTDPAKIKRGKYIPAKAEPPTSHKWIQ
jgi:hypothetical protein